MFSLIITIVSIALVAALALATLYFGGEAFNRGAADANATKLLTRGQQLMAAADLYRVDHEKWPDSVADLVAGNYLRSIPVAQNGTAFVSEAWAATEWEMPVAGQPVFVVPVGAVETCQSVNKRTTGMNGVFEKAHTELVAQCYGAAEYKVVFSKGAAPLNAVAAAAPQTVLPPSDITSAAVPAANSETGWSVAPANSENNSGGSSGGIGDATGPTTFGFSVGPAHAGAYDPLGPNLYVGTGYDLVLYLTNTGSGIGSVSGVSLSGAGSSEVAVEIDRCTGKTLTPGQSCSLQVDVTSYICGPASGGELRLTTSEGELVLPLTIMNVC